MSKIFATSCCDEIMLRSIIRERLEKGFEGLSHNDTNIRLQSFGYTRGTVGNLID